MSTILNLTSFIVFVTGAFILLDLPFFTFTDGVVELFSRERTDIRSQIRRHNQKGKEKGIKKTVHDALALLDLMGKKNKISLIWFLSIVLFIVGTVFSLTLKNFFLVPVLAIGLALTPFWYVIFTSNSYKKQVNEELEIALSTITTSYIRSENIILAVEENIHYLNPPISEVFTFFLSQTKLITSNTKLAIENMKPKIHNEVFREWCDALIACQDNKNIKHTLTPIVAKLSDTRIVSAELDSILMEPMKEFITMMILLLANIPLIRILNKGWFKILVDTPYGHGILALCILVMFIALAAVIRLTRPVEYKG